MHTPSPRPLEPCAEQCPLLIREVLELISAKWAVPIFVALHVSNGSLRYAELRDRLAGITPKELAKHLRRFEAAGLVSRRVFPTVPPAVDYSLTDLGEGLMPILAELAEWAARFGQVVETNVQAASSRPGRR